MVDDKKEEEKKPVKSSKKTSTKKSSYKKKPAGPLSFQEFQEVKGVDTRLPSGYFLAARAKGVDLSMKLTESQWDALFDRLC